MSDAVINGCVGGQLMSSLLAVTCVTVAFCSNLLMIRDKTGGAIHDLTITPVRFGVLGLGYYIATLVSTLIISFTATGACLIYMSFAGWYFTAGDVSLLLLDVLLLTMFGTALSSCVNFFLTTDGQASAVGTVVSAGYGFIRDSVDCNLAFFGKDVTIGAMYAILTGSILLFIGVYIAMNIVKSRRR